MIPAGPLSESSPIRRSAPRNRDVVFAFAFGLCYAAQPFVPLIAGSVLTSVSMIIAVMAISLSGVKLGIAGKSRGRAILAGVAAGTALQCVLVLAAGWLDEIGVPHHRPPFMNGTAGKEGFLILGILISAYAGIWEETAFRGYFLQILEKILGGGRSAIVAASIASSLLFGFAHIYMGPGAVIYAASFGLAMSAMYLGAGRNLWLVIAAHWSADVTSFIANYFGL